MLAGVEVAVPEQLVVTVRQRVDALLGLAILAVAVRVVRAAEDDRALLAGRRPLLDLPRAGLFRVREIEVEVERADMRLVPDLAVLALARPVVDLDRAVVAGRVVSQGGRRKPGEGREEHRGKQAQGPNEGKRGSRSHRSLRH